MKLFILYGSQTGNAQDLAERIWRQAKYHAVPETTLYPMDQFEITEDLFANPDETRFIFVCSTTGQGEVPDNMNNFWKIIMRKSIPRNLFESIQFSTIGLGDSSYEKYNFIAKKLYRRIIQLGGIPDTELCLCNEQDSDGIEGTFSRWIKSYWQSYSAASGVQKLNLNDKKSLILKYKINMNSATNVSDSSVVDTNSELSEVNEYSPFNARLTLNERATSDEHWQNTRFLEFDFADLHNPDLLKYEPGDVLMLRPSNLQHNIQKFYQTFQHLNLEKLGDQRIEIESNYKGTDTLCTPVLLSGTGQIKTVMDLVEKYFDLNSQPRMSFFEILAQIATDELEKEKLEEFIATDDGGQGLDELTTYCYKPRRTIMEVFFDFPKTCQNIQSLDILMEIIPSIPPRAFSIASSPYVHRNKIQILVAVVEYKTRLHETRKGTCSYWLSTLKPSYDCRVPIWIKKGSFSLNWSKPVICIGPGTGVAPFRSIINERIVKHGLKENHLYFGCRSQKTDYYFKDEWEEYVKRGDQLLEVNVAFSRDSSEKVYVQDLLLENSQRVFELLDKLEANILIAGSSNRMPDDVMAILQKIIQSNLNKNNSADRKSVV